MAKPKDRSNGKNVRAVTQGSRTGRSPITSGQRDDHPGLDVVIAQARLPEEFNKVQNDDMEEIIGWDWEDVAGETEENGWTVL